jgi:hypothetical protein
MLQHHRRLAPALQDMSNIAMGSEIGNIIADQQALMAALSIVYNNPDTASYALDCAKSFS